MGRIWTNGTGLALNAANLNALEHDVANSIKPWAAATDYTAGQPVFNPSGDIVTASAAHTSGSTYNPANWVQSPTFAPRSERNRPVGNVKTLQSTGTTHLGFPYAVTAPDGNLVVAWRDGANHTPSQGVMRVARYSQSGTVLTAAATAYSDATYDCRDAGLLVLADGRIAYTFFLYDYNAGNPILNGVRVMYSSDNGVTWGAPVTITSAFTTWAASAGPMIQLSNGNLLMPTYGTSAGWTYQHAHVSVSTDNGATWSHLAEIANGEADARHYQEPNLIVSYTGDILAVIRSDTTSAQHTARSVNGGTSWSATTQVFSGSGAPRLTKQAGYIECVYRNVSTGRAMKISSGDNGATWANAVTLPVSGSYVSSVYGVAIPYGDRSLRYIYSLQNGNPNNTATANLLQVDSIVPEDRGVPGPIGCRRLLTSTKQINTAAWTTISFDSSDFDTDTMASMANPTRITINTAGYYLVKATVYFASASPTQVQCRVIKNGSSVSIPGLRDKRNPSASQDSLVTATGFQYFNAGDYIELQGYQDSGAAISARTEDTVFSAMLMSAPI